MKNKGFTLVELLAVISLLALLFLLIIPKVKDIIDTNTNKTNMLTIKEIVKAAEDDYLSKEYTGTVKYSYNGEYLYYNDQYIYLSKKVKNAGGTVKVNPNNMQITVASINIGLYSYTYTNGKITYVKNRVDRRVEK